MITETIVDKLKARLCACGNELEEVDNDTYSPTVSALTHRLMLQLAVHDRMHISKWWTQRPRISAGTTSKMQLLFMLCSPNLDPKQTYRVLKYIYGLPDAGRAYYDASSEHLTKHGYHRTVSDPCLF